MLHRPSHIDDTGAMTTRMTAVLTGQVLSWLGDAFQVVALPVAIVVAGGSAGQMAAAITATGPRRERPSGRLSFTGHPVTHGPHDCAGTQTGNSSTTPM